MAGPTTPPPKDPLVALWFALGLLFVLFVGAATGLLAWLSGENVAAAMLTGFGAFGGTTMLVLLVINLFKR